MSSTKVLCVSMFVVLIALPAWGGVEETVMNVDEVGEIGFPYLNDKYRTVSEKDYPELARFRLYLKPPHKPSEKLLTSPHRATIGLLTGGPKYLKKGSDNSLTLACYIPETCGGPAAQKLLNGKYFPEVRVLLLKEGRVVATLAKPSNPLMSSDYFFPYTISINTKALDRVEPGLYDLAIDLKHRSNRTSFASGHRIRVTGVEVKSETEQTGPKLELPPLSDGVLILKPRQKFDFSVDRSVKNTLSVSLQVKRYRRDDANNSFNPGSYAALTGELCRSIHRFDDGRVVNYCDFAEYKSAASDVLPEEKHVFAVKVRDHTQNPYVQIGQDFNDSREAVLQACSSGGCTEIKAFVAAGPEESSIFAPHLVHPNDHWKTFEIRGTRNWAHSLTWRTFRANPESTVRATLVAEDGQEILLQDRMPATKAGVHIPSAKLRKIFPKGAAGAQKFKRLRLDLIDNGVVQDSGFVTDLKWL